MPTCWRGGSWRGRRSIGSHGANGQQHVAALETIASTYRERAEWWLQMPAARAELELGYIAGREESRAHFDRAMVS